MKLTFPWQAVGLFALCSGVAWADGPGDDPLRALLIPPEILIQHQKQIGLSDQQVEQIRARVDKFGPAAKEHEAKMKALMSQLVELLSAADIDEDGTLKLLDQFLAAENEMKQMHVRLLMQIRKELTADQRRTAAAISKAVGSPKELEQRLTAKVARIEKEVQSRADAGNPPIEIVEMMQKFPDLMQKGQVEDAEALLDRVMKMLGLKVEKAASKQRAPAGPDAALFARMQQIQKLAEQKQQQGDDVSAVAELMQQVGPLLKQGKQKEAQTIVDKVSKLLGVKDAQPEEKQPPK